MLSSIHPLGERSRNNSWGLTAGAFTLAAAATGAAVGALLGLLGSVLFGQVADTTLLMMTAIAALAAAGLDLVRVSPPGPSRQVNETWIGYYRGWVYGSAFGAQLGAGVATYIVTWGIYATLLSEVFTGSWLAGAMVGLVFGLGRSIALLAAGAIDRPSRLTSFNAKLASLGGPVRRYSSLSFLALGLIAVVGVVL